MFPFPPPPFAGGPPIFVGPPPPGGMLVPPGPIRIGPPAIGIAPPGVTGAGGSSVWKRMKKKKIGDLKLYHMTDKNAAEAIAKSGKMLRGSNGWFGGGIYFARTKAKCTSKAHNGHADPYFIYAKVKMGTALMLDTKAHGGVGRQGITHTALKNRGCNSVLAYNIASGNEYVVYNWARVKIISIVDKNGTNIYKKKKTSTTTKKKKKKKKG